MSSALGLVAEDETDYDAVRNIVHRVLGRSIKVRRRLGQGCSPIRMKARVWLNQLSDEGCGAAIVLHDLDRDPMTNGLRDENELRQQLEAACAGTRLQHLICIPVEEIEAWFWSDPVVVKKVGRGQGKASTCPARIIKPKEALIRLSEGANQKPRYSTNDNPELASLLDLDLCKQRCPSFAQMWSFLAQWGGGQA